MLTAMRHDMAELVDVDPESNKCYNEIYYASLGIIKMKKKQDSCEHANRFIYIFQVHVLHRPSTCAHVSLLVYSVYCW